MNTISQIGRQASVGLAPTEAKQGQKATDTLDVPFDLSMSPEDLVEALGKLIQKMAGQQRELAKSEKMSARQERIACEERELSEMKNKADSMYTGAMVSSACAIGSGVLGIAAAASGNSAGSEATKASKGFDYKSAFSGSSKSLSDLSRPLGQWTGDAPAAMHEASAKAASFASKRAEDRSTDATDRISEYQALAQEAAEAMKACRRNQDETIQGILRRM